MSLFGKHEDRITDAGKEGGRRGGESAECTGAGAAAAPTAAPVPHAAPPAGVASSAGTAPAPVDPEATTTDLEAEGGHQRHGRYAILDPRSLLGVDHGLADRQALTRDLGDPGDMHDSASLNTWRHGRVMTRMAEHGGEVPADLLDRATAAGGTRRRAADRAPLNRARPVARA